MKPINNRFDFQDELEDIQRAHGRTRWVHRFHLAGSILMAACVYADTKIISLAMAVSFLGSILAGIYNLQLLSGLADRTTHATTSFMASRVHAGESEQEARNG
ncbi:hypothetical protein IB275_30395 [Pseudomonas sp. PDM21]|uniref:hypothetical protein n=1 Tax=Pseudomonas sp. PDM21 TaxID=2769257 RepID=UPI001786B5F2|nr:hypothetical protein [Pseudomonas sp. PDM21]MBD9674926.1 hypothetical protein [Pseudomonas sp. PDM21]